jgi:hypothetical protein
MTMTTGTAPTLGRIVHFNVDQTAAQKLNALGGKRYNVGEKVAGIIARVLENNVINLQLFPDSEEIMYLGNVPFSTGGQPGTWNWPEMVGEKQQVAA